METVKSHYYCQRIAEVAEAFASNLDHGLTAEEASQRLEHWGKNELPKPAVISAWRRFTAQFRDMLTILLLVASAVSFVAWALESGHGLPYETLVIVAIVLVNAILGFVQEGRAEEAVAALQKMSAAQARVLRDGRQLQIPAAEVVPGDVLLIEEGDALAADGRVMTSIGLQVAEAALTGESRPVSKDSSPILEEVGPADQDNMVFSGTVAVSGRGRAIVTGTGLQTEIGKIAGALATSQEERTPMQRELDWVGKRLAIGVILIAVLIALILVVVGGVSSGEDLVQVLLVAVSLAVAAVPEGLSAITTITLSLGVQRMARRNVIVRKLSSVETLGSTTVICTDKTGTLTKNEMTVRAVITAGGIVDFSGTGYSPRGEMTCDGTVVQAGDLLFEVQKTLALATLANNANLIKKDEHWAIEGDPTEGALIVAAHKSGLTEAGVEEAFPRLGEVPFSSQRKMMSTVHREELTGEFHAAVKGAPDILLERCTDEQRGEEVRPLTPERREELKQLVAMLAKRALRTIGIAYRELSSEQEAGQWSEEHERGLVFAGLVGIMDPPRAEAKAAVCSAGEAGIRVIMITGDHPLTACAIAAELGIGGDKFMTGKELEAINEAQLQEICKEVSIFARVAPEHKLQIVRALKQNEQIVAMTGDGVNDAPALKAADIGIAMGITGTDVSKQAADMILSDDNFSSIVAAVEEGRSIFRSIRTALLFLLSSNAGEVLTMFLGVLLAGILGLQAEGGVGVIVPLLAVQILWINLLTDSAPALALAMEPSDRSLMEELPRARTVRVISGRMWGIVVFVGVVMAVGTLLVMDAALPGGLLEGDNSMPFARTMGFTTLVFFQLFNIFSARSPVESVFGTLFLNKWVWAAVMFSLVLQVLVIYLPVMQVAFGTVSLGIWDWVVCALVGSSVLWLLELKKALVG